MTHRSECRSTTHRSSSLLAFSFAAILFTPFTAPARGEAFRALLTSSGQSLSAESADFNGRRITPLCPVAWSIKKAVLHGGKQEGVEILVVDNGKLRFTVCPTRGMGLLSAQAGDVRLGWDSPVKEVVNPRNINLSARGGLGWLDGFNEWVVRCGLESNGHPGTDKFIDTTGQEGTMELTLHGKIANIPASEVEVIVEQEAPYRIHIRGRIDERMFHGPKLELQTDISTEPGSMALRIADVVTNRSAVEQEFQLLYHMNFGRPLLEAGSVFVAPVERVTPFNDRAAEGLKGYTEYAGPTAGFVEQVYCIRPFADADGRTLIMLRNQSGDRAASIGFSTKQLPYLTLWKNTDAEPDGYVTGLEPGTGYAYNRRIERSFGRVPKLAAGAAHAATIDIAVHVGADQVKSTADRIAAIQGGRMSTLDEKPVDLTGR
jgi:Domain of unknown function (DUF4432)